MFTEVDFLSAQTMAATSSEEGKLVDTTALESTSDMITPEEIQPLPQADRSRLAGRRHSKTVSTVLTAIPEKAKLEQTQAERRLWKT